VALLTAYIGFDGGRVITGTKNAFAVFLLAAMAGEAAASTDMCRQTIASLRGDLEAGRTDPRKVAQNVISAQEQLDRNGLKLASTPFPNTRLLDDAASLQARNLTADKLPPLYAVPINVKDMIDVAGLATSVGELALAAPVATNDAIVIGRLRRAGALITGKGSVNADREPSLSGFHSFGLTINPYGEALDPQGSSTGTGVAVASGQAIAGIGEETTDSLRGVADALGLASIRPTFGRLPTEGMFPLSVDRDVIGVLARQVTDAAIVVNVLAGCYDDGRPCNSSPIRSLRGLRIGVPLAYLGEVNVQDSMVLPFDPQVLSRFRKMLSVLKRDGAEIVYLRTPLLTPTDERLPLNSPYYQAFGFPDLDAEAFEYLYSSQTAQATDVYLKRRNGDQNLGLQELASQMGKDSDPAQAFFRDYITKMAQLSASGLTIEQKRIIAQYETALDRLYREQFHAVVASENIDALVHPTSFRPVMTVVGALRDPHGYAGENVLAMAAADFGLPAVTVPMGRTASGIPLTVTFLADRNKDDKVVAIAARYEKLTRLYQPPPAVCALPPVK
jgi:amidase